MQDYDHEHPKHVLAVLAQAILWVIWQVVRWSAYAFLFVLAPFVRVILMTLAVLGSLTTFMFEFASNVPNFPFWGMLTVSLGCLAVLVVYDALLQLLSHR